MYQNPNEINLQKRSHKIITNRLRDHQVFTEEV